jgi:uncharacterized coiled-coil protein SlyX
MENVVILGQAEYRALVDKIQNLTVAAVNANLTRYFINKQPVSANEYIDYLQKQNAELLGEESIKDSMDCEQRDLVERLRDDLSNQSNYIEELSEDIAMKQGIIDCLTDALDSIRY